MFNLNSLRYSDPLGASNSLPSKNENQIDDGDRTKIVMNSM